MNVYLWLKAFHVAAAMTWISGMVVAALAIRSRQARADVQTAQEMYWLDTVRRWDRCFTFPAMLMVWGLGITMAMLAGWFSSPWLMIKLVIVGALSALHGMLSGLLRGLGRSADPPPSAMRYAGPATILGVVMIAVLAVTKPF
jgi:putative membrane protein